jgi:hypothetical protein
MLEVDRQSGGFTPPAQLNVFDFLFTRGGISNYSTGAEPIPLGIRNSNIRFSQKAPPTQC